ncbi:GTP-binding protein EsdC [Apiospora kogelbergensis]|uniref:GTP-binding protein EsdC n=1 Tax=Apiospora kogelbergensis TaxID=1337665 RepID=UPI00313263CE
MATVQLSFSLRVSSGVKSVHLLGSWDNYVGQLPLSRDKTSSKGNLEAGQRYWYYYIIDGYHVSHNPSEKSTVEPTTGRELNILDVPKDKSHKSSSSSSKSHSSSSSKSSSRHSSSSSSSKDSKHRSSKRASLTVDIPKGRPLSTSQIKAPKPITPHATRHILDVDYCDEDAIEELTARFGSADIDEDVITDFSSSPVSSNGSSLSYRSDSSSPNSSLSGYSTPSSDCSNCTCERYGITRKGDRVKIDCGGARCGFSDDDSACSSSGDEEEYVSRSSRRNGIVVPS